jgi:hypothetical protein
MSCGDDLSEIFDQALAIAATGDVFARRFRQRSPSLLLKDDCYLFTLHGPSLR